MVIYHGYSMEQDEDGCWWADYGDGDPLGPFDTIEEAEEAVDEELG